MLAPAAAQYTASPSANPYAPRAAASPYAPGAVTNPYTRPSSAANPYVAPKMYGSQGADRHALPVEPYDPEALSSNRFIYSPDGTRTPYNAGYPYAPTVTNPYRDRLREPGND